MEPCLKIGCPKTSWLIHVDHHFLHGNWSRQCGSTSGSEANRPNGKTPGEAWLFAPSKHHWNREEVQFFFWGGGYWVKIGRNWGIKGPALGWTTFDPDFSFRIKPLDSSPTRSLVFLCPNLADLRPNRSKPEKCSNDNDLLLASFLGTWAGWQFFFLLQDFLQRGPCMATLLPRCPWSSAAQLVKHGQTIQFHVYIWHKKNLLLIYMQMPYACNSKWLHMPWNDHGIQTGHAASLFQSCRLALMDWSFPNCRHFIAVTKMASQTVPCPESNLIPVDFGGLW